MLRRQNAKHTHETLKRHESQAVLFGGRREVVVMGGAVEGLPGFRQHCVSSPGFHFVIIH